jgi:squalene cyclase
MQRPWRSAAYWLTLHVMALTLMAPRTTIQSRGGIAHSELGPPTSISQENATDLPQANHVEARPWNMSSGN